MQGGCGLRIRGRDHTWKIIKYDGVVGLTARCKCGFQYGCNYGGSAILGEKPDFLYTYCPNCGSYKKYQTDIIEVDGFPF